jgi:hypothetical protein
MRLLEGIFLFSVRDKIGREDYDLEKEMNDSPFTPMKDYPR